MFVSLGIFGNYRFILGETSGDVKYSQRSDEPIVQFNNPPTGIQVFAINELRHNLPMIKAGYVEPLFRPPSEANNLVLRVTIDCSWNNCTFCGMYTQPQKRFRFKSVDEIGQELALIAKSGVPVRGPLPCARRG
jgi:radical SAM superfamily enzyme YgiQ (UPF0313 family)